LANIVQTKNGYRAQVYVGGQRPSKTFRTKREALVWASQMETKLRDDKSKPPSERKTFADTLERYRDEVSPTKKGSRWEQVRINAFLESKILPTRLPIGEVTSDHLGKWRDQRLKEVSSGTVLREFGLLSAVFDQARREWKWIQVNPVADVRKPREPDHREVIITWSQVRRQLKSLGYSYKKVRTISQAAAITFLVALRTGGRAGELCSLPWTRVYEDHATVNGKTGERHIPLTAKTKRLIGRMEGFDDTLVFGISSQTLDALFRRARVRAGMEGFTFHDSRHTAATWIAAKMKSSGVEAQQAVLDLCKIFGWSNINQALTYYNPKMSDIVKRL
jgi:integrase